MNLQIAANSNLAISKIRILLPNLALRQKRKHCTSGTGHFALEALCSQPVKGLTDRRTNLLGYGLQIVMTEAIGRSC